MREQPRLQGSAAIAACALLLVALFGWPFIALQSAASAQPPDPFIANGDPCCGHPDTWGEVASGVALALGLIAIDALLLTAAAALIKWSTSGSWPRWRRLAWLPIGALIVSAVAFAAVLIPQRDKARVLPDCDRFVLREADWRSSNQDRHLATTWAIADCGTFSGADRRTVERRLGKPKSEGPLGARYYLSYDGLDLILDGDRVAEVDAGYDDD